jgi:hypothetical protein
MNQDNVLAAAKRITPEQTVRAIQLLYFQADGCSFINSREFKIDDCAKENGRGYDCSSCAATKLLHELGLKTQDELLREEQEERERLRAATRRGR